MGITHRPEIDGLRAIAVIAVVLYHAGLGGAGFVGVDVFFVISGYLITALLLREWSTTHAIDLLAFYARRVRRIFPVATFVVVAVLVVASLLSPLTLKAHTSFSAAAAAVFGANIFLQFTSGGYFDGRAEEMPLLHLWSLSVEEQFYFLWPALLIVVLRYRPRWLLSVIAALGLASFALAEAFMAANPEAAFYQMPARYWELAAGGLIAALPVRALPRHAASLGVLVTVAGCVYPVGHFPGIGAVPAVAGAVLIILAVHSGETNAFLRSRSMVGVGLLSYSLYLWHWPLLAFYRATSIGPGSAQMRLTLCAVALLLAIASYRYIEQPFRRMRVPRGGTVTTGAAVSLSLALAACTYGFQAQREQGVRSTDNPLAMRAARDMPSRACRYLAYDTTFPKCPDPPGARVAIWGDSMAYAWRPLAEKLGATIDYSRDTCPPLVGFLPPKVFPGDEKCRNFNARVAERAKSLDTVILAGWWWVHFSADRVEAAERGLRDTLMQLAGVRRVVILGPTPEMREQVPRCIRQNALDQCAVPRPEFDGLAASLLAKLRAMAAAHPNVEIIDPTDHFCTAIICPPVKGGVALYWDTHHVSSTAARGFVLPTRRVAGRRRTSD
ncbi:MAG: acyltransferase family protein [Gammaproteobacteria bacterium]